MSRTYLGIDGGGSTLRAVLIDDNMEVLARAYGSSANPNAIGRDEAAKRIQALVRQCLSQRPTEPNAVGIGIAGASAAYASAWLRETVQAVLPDTSIVPSSDHEIALTGAMGRREGCLLIAGTGSVAFGIDDTGQSYQVGGWGYLLGDEGSGYWIGRELVQACIEDYDAGSEGSAWPIVRDYFGIATPRDLITAIYLDGNPVPKLAGLAPDLIQAATAGNPVAEAIINQAVQHLEAQFNTLQSRMLPFRGKVALAGSLLIEDTPLRQIMRERLSDHFQPTLHSPVVGAALLAKLHTLNA